MRTSPILALLALSFFATSARAQSDDDGMYFTLSFGGTTTDSVDPPGLQGVEYDTGVSFSAGLGLPITRTGSVRWSLEGEWYTSFTKMRPRSQALFPGTKEDTARASAFLLNLAAECPLATDLQLYAAGGVGFAPALEFDTMDSGNYRQLDRDGTVVQAKIGLRYALGRNYDVTLGYRYFTSDGLDVQNLTTSQIDNVNYTNQVIEVGFRWGI
ncbi:MAG TPA: hypothetical protein ENJ09_09440 [Planctomycetes bacterium]|nr:hypothetical protein [Planctomycetota bacterium]